MLTSIATCIALSVICVLLYIWGRRQQTEARRHLRALVRCQDRAQRSARSAQQWLDEVKRLREVVDRVEG